MENYVVTKELKGQSILDALEIGIADYPATKGAFPHIAGIRVKYNPNRAKGEKLVSVTLSNGNKLDPNATYTVATNDFIAAGGDGYKMFKGLAEKGNYAGLDEILISYIQGKRNLQKKTTDGRMVIVK